MIASICIFFTVKGDADKYFITLFIAIFMCKIISAPLVFPKIEPDSWDEWWNVWNKEAAYVKKINQSHNPLRSPWIGFDICVSPEKNDYANYHYDFKNINQPELFSKFFSNLDDFPLEINIMRAASTFVPARPHKDFIEPTFSVRSMLYDSNPKSTWYYLFDNKRTYLTLPEDTNTWIYPDHESQHGSDFDSRYRKILLLFFGTLKPGYPEKAFNDSLAKYKDYIISKQ